MYRCMSLVILTNPDYRTAYDCKSEFIPVTLVFGQF